MCSWQLKLAKALSQYQAGFVSCCTYKGLKLLIHYNKTFRFIFRFQMCHGFLWFSDWCIIIWHLRQKFKKIIFLSGDELFYWFGNHLTWLWRYDNDKTVFSFELHCLQKSLFRISYMLCLKLCWDETLACSCSYLGWHWKIFIITVQLRAAK